MSVADDDDVLKDFINESREHLATIEGDLVTIEEGGADIDEQLVNKVFRAAHSIKGGSAFFGLEQVKALAHRAETILDMLRARQIIPNAEVTNLLLAAFDTLRDMINNTAASEHMDISTLLTSLDHLAASYLAPEQQATLNTEVTLQGPAELGAVKIPRTDMERVRRTGQYIYWLDCDLIHDVEQQGHTVIQLFHDLTAVGEILDCSVDYMAVGSLDGPVVNRLPLRLIFATIMQPDHVGMLFESIDPERIHQLLEPNTVPATVTVATPPAPAPKPLPAAAVTATPPAPKPLPTSVTPTPPTSSVAASTVTTATQSKSDTPSAPKTTPSEDTLRIPVELLETLMNLAGELVLSRNQLRAAVAQNNRPLLVAVDQRVNQVTSELQDVIMQTRLQPIGNVFSKFPRVVRDLSQTLGKGIDLDIQGKDVALDKTLIEGLSDPLTHMVRNAVDHGIETSAERIQAGKKPTGQIRIEARHEAGQVVVEIADDGKGIDGDKVAEACVRKGLIPREKIIGLSERDKQALIFLPGLSTAQTVSEVSGRGVGMDVVKTNLDRLGGQVEIHSELGKGSIFRIKLPLTLAIIPSLIISLGQQRFAIPQANIEELLRLRPEDIKSRIEVIGDSEVLLLRDRLLPLARLIDVFGALPNYVDPVTGQREFDRRLRLADRRSPRHPLDEPHHDTPQPSPSNPVKPRIEDRRQCAASAIEIAVVTTGTLSYALAVDAFHDTEEIVVKPLGQRFKALREYSGATILGDGTVALILDMAGIANKAGLASVDASARAAQLAAEAEAQRLQDVHALLLFENGPGEPCAVPADLVQRIERITPQQIERLGHHRSMQYRGQSLPLVALSDAATVADVDNREDLVVLVTNAHGHDVGLLGAMPVDVITTRIRIDQTTHRQKGISGSAIINNKTTLIADLYELVDKVHPNWAAAAAEIRQPQIHDSASGGLHVLLAEDSDFFRAQVKKYLEEDGLKVLAAPDGEAAWELLLKHIDKVRIVVTDIEMPRLTGLGLTQRIRADQRTAGLPVIAVTSLAGVEDVEKGKAAGVTDYQVKLDRDKLLTSIHAMTQAA